MIWKDIKGFEGLYQISEYGDVKTLESKQIRKLKQGYVQITLKEKVMGANDIKKTTRYKAVGLTKKDGTNQGKTYFIHQLVYQAFIGDIDSELVIDHIDEDRNNNHYTNLEQITQAENVRRYFLRKQKQTFFGDKKLCNRCKDVKPTDDFYLRTKERIYDWNPDKWRGICKSCSNKKSKEYWLDNKENLLEKNRIYSREYYKRKRKK